jgi:hypothetical protein
MIVAVTETWHHNIDDTETIKLHFKLDEMEASGKFLRHSNNERSIYNSDGSPTKLFSSMEAAEEYIAYQSVYGPASTTVKAFDNNADLLAYLETLNDVSAQRNAGPSVEAHEQYIKQLKNSV